MADIIYPFIKNNYMVAIGSDDKAGFSEVSSPDITADPIEYREGNMAGKTPSKQPGILKYGNVTLKHGVTSSTAFTDWMKEIQDGKVNRKTVTITLLDDEMKPVAEWELVQAWPTKYTATDLNATINVVAIVSLELVTVGVKRTI